MITIIDYDAGNIKSVEKAFEYIGEKVLVTSDLNEISNAEKLVLPGVGSFGDAMEKLNKKGLTEVIRNVVAKGIPILGICLGLQLMFDSSEESPGVEGLSLLPGKIVRIPDKEGFKIPHMGWNSLELSKESRLFKGLEENPYVYFVHSYYLKASKPEQVAAVTDYVTEIHAAVEADNIYACQFHPEKSGDTGLKILKNFAEL